MPLSSMKELISQIKSIANLKAEKLWREKKGKKNLQEKKRTRLKLNNVEFVQKYTSPTEMITSQ